MKKMKKKNRFWDFKRARKFVITHNIKNMKQYAKFSKNYDFIPSRPQDIYQKKGWVSWGVFLKTGNKTGGVTKYIVNHNFFKQWSREMAYILGFWFADGCINKNNNTFVLDQHKKDIFLLENIKIIMRCNKPIQTHASMARLTISSPIIVKDIIKLGGKTRKSLNVCFPKIPKKYLSDFIRGYFDGDGSIWYAKHHKSYWSNFTCGSRKFIYDLHKILKSNIFDLSGSIHRDKRGTYTLCLAKNNTFKLKNFMYHNNPRLKMFRKYFIFKTYCV
jgi:hypothetical protein